MTALLIVILQQTYSLLTGELHPKSYTNTAEALGKDPDLGLAIVSGVMIALGLFLGTLLLATSLITVPAGIAGTCYAAALVVMGIGLFAESCRTKTPFTELMHSIATAKENDPIPYSPMP